MHPSTRNRLRTLAVSLALCIGAGFSPARAFAAHPAPIPVQPPPTRLASTKTELLGFTLFKGDLHAHPRGHCPEGESCANEPAPRQNMADVFHMAKMTGADFFASTDHDISESGYLYWGNEGTVGTGLTLFEAWRDCLLPLEVLAIGPWFFAEDSVDAHSSAEVETDTTFVGIAGYELTHGNNHMNIFDMVEWVRPGGLCFNGTITDRMNNLAGRIQQGRTPIVHFNHPESSAFNSFALHPGVANNAHLMEIQHDYTIEDNNFVPMLTSFRLALKQGWKLAPTATSDRHAEYGTEAFPGDFRQFPQRTGIAVPVGMPLTRANLFSAIRQRRTFSSSSPHLSAMYKANNLPMGSILTGSSPGPVDFTIEVRDTAAQNICSIELWTSRTDRFQPLVVWPTPAAGTTLTFNHRLWLPYFQDYFFIVNAASTCNSATPSATSRLVTAPIWTAAQYPKPTASAPSPLTPGNSLTVQWAAPWVGNMQLQVYKLNNGGSPEPVGQPVPVANNSQPTGQYTWSPASTAGWALGTYRIGLVDVAYPGYEWKTQNIRVDNPPEPPPVECRPGRLCN